jgi:RNA polymerase sigma factor (sigma-70 family)
MPRAIRGSRGGQTGVLATQHDELLALAEAVQKDDERALRTFLAAIVPHQMRVVRRVLGPNRADVEDVTYEAAYAAVDGLERFRGESTVLHYACRVAVLVAMKVRRAEATQKRTQAQASAEGAEEPFAEGLDPEQAALQASLAPIVRELFGSLSAPHAEALALHVVLGYTVAEIAQLSEVPDETVRSRLRLAKQALRKRVMSHPTLREVVGGEA